VAADRGGLGGAAVVGAVLALVLAATAAGVGWLLLRTAATPRVVDSVVVVFAAPDENGAMVAQFIANVSRTGTVDISPETTVSVPGTTAGPLGGLYAFGGSQAIAAALATSSATPDWLDLPPEAWKPLIDSAGGIDVTLAKPLDVFDGKSYSHFPEGSQKMGGDALVALLAGSRYLSSSERTALRQSVEKAIVEQLTTSATESQLSGSSLTADEMKEWLSAVATGTH
jgi:hypothetical protein